MIRCGNYKTIRGIVFEELKEGIQNTSNLTHIIIRRTVATEGVNFVEQVNTTHFYEGIKYETQLRSCLSHEFRDDCIEADGK